MRLEAARVELTCESTQSTNDNSYYKRPHRKDEWSSQDHETKGTYELLEAVGGVRDHVPKGQGQEDTAGEGVCQADQVAALAEPLHLLVNSQGNAGV